MNDKKQLAAMGEHLAEQQPLCMAKRIEELEANVREMAELLRDLHGYIGASIPQTISEHYRGCDLLDRIDAALAGDVPYHVGDANKMVDEPSSKTLQLVAPEGWQLVPRMPTTEMCDAFKKADADWEDGWAFDDNGNRHDSPVYQWVAMLNAAPKPEAK